MAENTDEKKLTPPYLPYKTLINFLERLKVGIPARIDRSVMGSFSGAIQAALFTALKYLQLVNREHIPTEKLTKIVLAEGEERKKLLREIITVSYPFLFREGLDLKRATAHQIQELFDQSGASGGTITKSITFFMAAAKDAGIELSPHLKIKGAGRKPGKTRKGLDRLEKQDNGFSQSEEPSAGGKDSLAELQVWLSMFPKFDPTWTDEIKAKWFDGFRDLRKDFKQKSDDDKEVGL